MLCRPACGTTSGRRNRCVKWGGRRCRGAQFFELAHLGSCRGTRCSALDAALGAFWWNFSYIARFVRASRRVVLRASAWVGLRGRAIVFLSAAVFWTRHDAFCWVGSPVFFWFFCLRSAWFSSLRSASGFFAALRFGFFFAFLRSFRARGFFFIALHAFENAFFFAPVRLAVSFLLLVISSRPIRMAAPLIATSSCCSCRGFPGWCSGASCRCDGRWRVGARCFVLPVVVLVTRQLTVPDRPVDALGVAFLLVGISCVLCGCADGLAGAARHFPLSSQHPEPGAQPMRLIFVGIGTVLIIGSSSRG